MNSTESEKLKRTCPVCLVTVNKSSVEKHIKSARHERNVFKAFAQDMKTIKQEQNSKFF